MASPLAASPAGSPVSNPHGAGKFQSALVSVLFLLAIGVYANSLFGGFVYDDKTQILENPYIQSWHYLPEIFRGNVWSFLGPARASNYYRPFLSLTYLVLWQAFGDLPIGYHLLNILLNALVVVSVYLAGLSLLKNRFAAAAAALLFCFHPVHVQPVSWIDGVADVQITLLLLLAFSIYIADAPLNWRRQALIGLCFASALLIKEPAITFVALLPLYDFLVAGKFPLAGIPAFLRKLLPTILITVAYIAGRIVLLGQFAPVLQHPQLSWSESIDSAFALIGQYAQLLVFSRHLSAFHTFHKASSLWQAAPLLGFAVFACYILCFLLLRKRFPQAAFSLAWIGVTLLPVLNARWMAANVLNERYLYLPSVGFVWFMGWALSRVWDAATSSPRWRPLAKPAFAAAGIALMLWGGATIWARSADWRDDYTLYSAAIKFNPDAWDARMNLGAIYLERGNLSAAERELRIARRLNPDAYYVRNALGCVFLEEGNLDAAESEFREGLAIQNAWPDLHYNYGRLLMRRGEQVQALEEFRRGVAAAPLNARAHFYYAQALAASGQDLQAESEFRAALSLSESSAAEHGLVDLLLKHGGNSEAEQWLRKMAASDPYDAKSHLQLARLLEAAGKNADARKEYQAVLVSDPRNQEANDAARRLANSPN
jgi:Tfp pilus assembly protein PilF